MPVSVSGNYAGNRDKLEVKNLKGRIGENEFSARASMVGTGKKRVELELASPRLDLTPFLAEGSSKPEAQPKKPERKFVFDEAPLPFDKLKLADARLHFSAAEVRLGPEVLRDVDSTLRVDGGRLTLEARVRRRPRRHHDRRPSSLRPRTAALPRSTSASRRRTRAWA